MKLYSIAGRLLLTIFCLCSFTAKVAATDYTIEAENGTMSNCSTVSDSKFSGGSAVHMTEGSSSLTLTFNVAVAGKYKVVVNACGDGDGKVVNCSVNGTTATFTANSDLIATEVGTYRLDAGTNTVVITPNWTWYYIDYVSLVDDNAVVPFNISSTPVTSGATQSACQLYTFLKNNFGTKTVSGIMTGSMDNVTATDITTQEDVKAVYSASGKYPALVGFDFMNATGKDVDSGNSWYTDYTNTAISLAKDLWNRGGIPAFCWHWRDPSRSTSEFYTSKTSFNFTTAMNSDGSWNTSSTAYKYMVKDIDAVADYFLQLQTAGVACIFRPLHEAPGAWFWWGAQGADNYIKLYHLIYNEMVNVKGVKNIIWDWNTDYTKTEWCPGSDYYDIVSTDIYNDAYDYSSNYVAFEKLKTLSGAAKMISLSECGPIPDIENEANDEAMWTHWMVWYNSWNSNFVTSKTSNSEWTKVMSDSRMSTLDNMPGWPLNIVLNDDTPYTATADVTASSATYTRTCNYEWGTLCLPFAYSSNSDVQYYTVQSCNAVGIIVSPITDVSAGQPVIFKILSGADADNKYTLSVSAIDATVKSADYGKTLSPVTGWSMNGTYQATTIQNGSLYKYYIAKNQAWSAETSVNVAPYHIWLEGPSVNGAKALVISVLGEGTASGIIKIDCDVDNAKTGVFNLQGQRLCKPQKGINIIGGKKIFVRNY